VIIFSQDLFCYVKIMVTFLHLRLEEAGISQGVLDEAISSFILEVVAKHAEPSNRLCNKVQKSP